MTFFHHGRTSDITLFLQLQDPSTRQPVTGAGPQVQIRRHRDSETGALLDGYYWNGTTFVSSPQWLGMPEFDPVNSPGLYTYFFEQSLVSANVAHLVYFRHTAAPTGFAIEEHVFTDVMESNIRGADNDDLKTISDQISHISILDKTTFYIWPAYAPITVTLFVVDPGTSEGLPGQVPYITLTIRRANDAKYWDGAAWVDGAADLVMTEIDEVEEPGLYQYVLPAAANNQEALYVAHANVDNLPTVAGDSYEIHESRIVHDPSQGSPFDPTGVLP